MSLDEVFNYHQRTKHRPDRHARSLGYLDWASQPLPYRLYDGAEKTALDRPGERDAPSYDQLFQHRSPERKDRAFVSRLFYNSLALSAWKQIPDSESWAMRVNPSSGNLHPTEGYLVCGSMPDLEGGVYHYAPYLHALERRRAFAGEAPLLVALSSIYWRESWKYGERAFRYCHHDVGHAMGALALAAASLGCGLRVVEDVSHADLAVLLGIDGQIGMEAEHPDVLLSLSPEEAFSMPLVEDPLKGKENQLSREHHAWPIIDEVSKATKFSGSPPPSMSEVQEPPPLPDRRLSADRIIRQRRSAVAMDGSTTMDCESFFRVMQRLTAGSFPYTVLPWQPAVSLALFVHRVDGLKPGLYLLVRSPDHRPLLEASLSKDFLWERTRVPELFLLEEGDLSEWAGLVSCRQPIAADSVFSLSMLARFESFLTEMGPWFYPRLFWEAGLIGQVLYLEAEAAGLRATGIGCFYDDLVHQRLGLNDAAWQSLYHLTVGGPVEDDRLITLPAYAHLS